MSFLMFYSEQVGMLKRAKTIRFPLELKGLEADTAISGLRGAIALGQQHDVAVPAASVNIWINN